MISLQKRVEELERAYIARTGSMFTVYFKDGKQKTVHPGDVLKMSLFEGDKIERFEEGEDKRMAGLLKDFATSFLFLAIGNFRKDDYK